MAQFEVGGKVVCIQKKWFRLNGRERVKRHPKFEQEYTIKATHQFQHYGQGLKFEELEGRIFYMADCFRPIQPLPAFQSALPETVALPEIQTVTA